MHSEGLNNAINSTTIVAILIASVAFSAIYQVPGQFIDKPNHIPKGHSLGESNVAIYPAFVIFFVFDSIALFISLAVVVIESKAKKQMMAVMNKLVWLACVLVMGAFSAMSYIIVGKKMERFATGTTIVRSILLTATVGTMCYWVIRHRINASKMKNIRKMESGSRSPLPVVMSDSEILTNDFKMYAL